MVFMFSYCFYFLLFLKFYGFVCSEILAGLLFMKVYVFYDFDCFQCFVF